MPHIPEKNSQISKIFKQMANILEFKGENPFKINAYRKASRIIGELGDDIEGFHKQGKLQAIPGIGSGIAKKVEEYLKTGRVAKYQEISEGVPEELIKLMSIQNVGPRTLALAHEKLGVKDIDGLRGVIENGSLAALPGMGIKKVENIAKGIEYYLAGREKVHLGVALPLAKEIIEELKRTGLVREIAPAGSLRRMKERVGDIDILVVENQPGGIIGKFTHLPQVTDILASGETKASVIMDGKAQVDLRVIGSDSFGSAMQYFTGSKAHNIRLREIAKRKGLKINEYGVFKAEKKIGGKDENDIYAALELPWIPPEMREDRGEIETALEGKLPKLIKYKDIKGDLHIHSNWSDGAVSIEEIANRAKELGYDFIGICDHSGSARYAGGLSEGELLRQLQSLGELNKDFPDVEIFSGAEVDIKNDGRLDYSDGILERLDIVTAAIHSGFKKNVTDRIIRAMENPNVDIIAHPTGRLISSREGYDIDIKEIIEKAAQTNTVLEINAYYDRLDLSDLNCKSAKEAGVKLSIGTDAHHLSQFDSIRLGIGVARRGWLEPKNLLNTFPAEKLKEFFYTPKPER